MSEAAETTAAATTEQAATTETKAAETTQATEAKAAETTQATETKPAETKEAKPADTKAEEVAVVDYAKAMGEVKLPEGMVLDEAAVKEAGALFGELKLNAEQASKLTGLYAGLVQKGQQASAAAFADQVGKWKTASLADKDVGGKEGMAEAKTAATKLFPADTLQLLEHFGLMDNASFIKSMRKINTAIKDDSFIPGDAGSGGGGRDARSLYPNSNMNE